MKFHLIGFFRILIVVFTLLGYFLLIMRAEFIMQTSGLPSILPFIFPLFILLMGCALYWCRDKSGYNKTLIIIIPCESTQKLRIKGFGKNE